MVESCRGDCLASLTQQWINSVEPVLVVGPGEETTRLSSLVYASGSRAHGCTMVQLLAAHHSAANGFAASCTEQAGQQPDLLYKTQHLQISTATPVLWPLVTLALQ